MEEWGRAKRLNWSRAKPSREYAKLSSSLSGILEFMMGPSRLQRAWVAPPLFPFTIAPCNTHSISLQLISLYASIFSWWTPQVLASRASQDPHYNLGCTFTLSDLSEPPCRDFNHASCCLAPASLWNCKNPWWPPLNLASFVPLKLSTTAWPVLPSPAASSEWSLASWTTMVATSVYLSCWLWWNTFWGGNPFR